MPDNNDLGVEQVPDVPELPQVQEGQQDTTDWKKIATENHGRLKEIRGIAKRNATKLEKALQPSGPRPQNQPDNQPQPTNQAKKGFDYAEKAFMLQKGVSEPDFEFVQEQIAATGKTLDDLLNSGSAAGKIFAAELKERAEQRGTANAIPSTTKRSNQGNVDEVDYWLTKVEAGTTTIGQIPDGKMRQKVVNARMALKGGKGPFYNS